MTAPVPYYDDGQVSLYLGDCLDVLAGLPDSSVDAIVTDPPYGLAEISAATALKAITAWVTGDRAHVPDGRGFMGREWDRFVPPPAVWDECLRVLKPGGHLLAFAGARTQDLMGLSIRLAGFEIRDGLDWIYGSGMPHGQDIAKSIDRRRDDRQRVLQVTAWLAAARDAAGWSNARVDGLFGTNGMAGHWTTQGVAAIVPTPEQWAVLREALGFDDMEILPVVEELNARKGLLGEDWARREVVGHSHRVRRPSDVQLAALSEGAYDITVPAAEAARQWEGWNTNLKPAHEPIILARKSTGFHSTVANVLLHGTGALNIDGCRVGGGPRPARSHEASASGLTGSLDTYGSFAVRGSIAVGETSEGRWPPNILLSEEAAADLDQQTGTLTSGANPSRRPADKFRDTYGEFAGQAECTVHRGADSGGASRFFPVFRYAAKAPASERPRLGDGTAHNTVKPLDLMRWLVRLVTPPGGTVGDFFAGSGTTAEACIIEGFNCILIEKDPASAELIKTRLSKPIQPDLFGGAA